MNAISVAPAQAMGAMATNGSTAITAAGEAPAQGFASMLLSLLGGETTGETDGLDSILALLGQDQAEADQEGSLLGSQMMAELLAATALPMLAFPGGLSPTQAQELLSATEQQGNALSVNESAPLLTLLPQLPSQNAAAEAVLGQTSQNAPTAPNSFLAMAEQLAKDQAPNQKDASFAVLSAAQATTEQPDSEFFHAVSEAKKQLFGQDSAQKQESPLPIDFEQLQQQVNARAFAPATEVSKLLANELEAAPLLEQVKTGILNHLDLGKGEFVIKLKPEGLGEITVRMVEENSKMTLSIVTSSAQVAKLLSNDLASLQQSLKAHHAEVREVLDQQQYAWQQDSAQQQFARQQQQQHQQQHTPTVYWGDSPEEISEELSELKMVSGLDTYI